MSGAKRPADARDCPWPHCKGFAKGSWWGCPSHWANLPASMQREWMMAEGDPETREAVALRIQAWIDKLHADNAIAAAPVAAPKFHATLAPDGSLQVRTDRLTMTYTVGEVATIRRVLRGEAA